MRFIKVLIPAEASVTRGHSASGCCEMQLLLALCSPACVTLHRLQQFDAQFQQFHHLLMQLIYYSAIKPATHISCLNIKIEYKIAPGKALIG